jgi:hypothetical protein
LLLLTTRSPWRKGCPTPPPPRDPHHWRDHYYYYPTNHDDDGLAFDDGLRPQCPRCCCCCCCSRNSKLRHPYCSMLHHDQQPAAAAGQQTSSGHLVCVSLVGSVFWGASTTTHALVGGLQAQGTLSSRRCGFHEEKLRLPALLGRLSGERHGGCPYLTHVRKRPTSRLGGSSLTLWHCCFASRVR